MKCLTALAVVLACGCATSAGQTPSGQQGGAPSRAPWSVTFHLSGGFAGMMRNLQVSNTGDVSAEDTRRATKVAAKATADELAALNSFIAQQIPSHQARSSSCADCVLYELNVDASGRRSNFTFDDATLMASGIEPAVRTLMAILNRALMPAAASVANQKVDSQLLIEIGKREDPSSPSSSLTTIVRIDPQGRALVDIRADVTAALVEAVQSDGGAVVSSSAEYRSTIAWVPLLKIKTLAANPAVRAISPAAEAATNIRR